MELTKPEVHAFQAQPGFDIGPYFPHALAATLAVFGLPAAIVFGLIMLPTTDPSVVVTSILSIALSTVASVIGTSIWMRHPASSQVSFGDLMIWGWVRRRRAEGQLDRGTRLLGLDRRGQPVQRIRITHERQLKVLHDLNDALEAKDPYTRGHSERVERHVYRTAAAMGLSVHDLQELRMAAALHDIGKIRVPDRIIRKPGKLTAEEMSLMEEHSVVGAWMLSHVASADVIEAVRHHHERWDGKGYPDGLAGTDIPLYARIIAVCDTFDAITSTRPYRAKSDRERAVRVLKEESGSQFDPMAVEVFLKSIPDKMPITAMLVLLPGAGKVVRELARFFKRAGATSLVGATTAASATVMIGAATVVPAFDRIPVRIPQPVAGPATPGPASAGTIVTAPTQGPVAPTRDLTSSTPKKRDRVADLDGDLTRESSTLTGTAFDAAEGTAPIDQAITAAGPESPAADVLEGIAADEQGNSEEHRKNEDRTNEKPEKDKGKDSDSGSTAETPGNSGNAGGGKGSEKDKNKGKDDDAATDDGSGDDTSGETGDSDPGNGNGNSGGNGNGNSGGNGNDPDDTSADTVSEGNGNGHGNGNSDKDKENGGGPKTD